MISCGMTLKQLINELMVRYGICILILPTILLEQTKQVKQELKGKTTIENTHFLKVGLMKEFLCIMTSFIFTQLIPR